MIQLPKRSVTRFFIPLIDVLTLLFCIFLVMPLAQNSDQAQLTAKEAELELLREKGADTRALEAELEKLRKQLRLADKFPPTRVLEIDAKTGRLFYRDPGPIEIRDGAAAEKLVDSDRTELGVRKAELYYLILYPRTTAPASIRSIRNWTITRTGSRV